MCAFSAFRGVSRVEVAVLLSNFGKRDLLGRGDQLRRRLERLVQLGEQVATDEQLLAQLRSEIR
jgi:hypothetical protein